MTIYTAGKTVVALLYPLLKAIQVYDIKNDVVINSAKKFVDFIEDLFSTISSLEFVRYRDYIFFNKQRLKYEIDSYANLTFLNNRLKNLKINSITFMPGINQQDIDLNPISPQKGSRNQHILSVNKRNTRCSLASRTLVS